MSDSIFFPQRHEVHKESIQRKGLATNDYFKAAIGRVTRYKLKVHFPNGSYHFVSGAVMAVFLKVENSFLP